jgi:hypothetical protein
MNQFIPKDVYYIWPDNNSEQNAKQGSVKMGIVIDMISALSGHICRID